MSSKLQKLIYTTSFLILSLLTCSCGTVTVPDTKGCSVAGKLSAGALCATAISGQKTELTFEEFMEMLEPTAERGGAIVIPIDDFIDLKTAFESACVYVKCKKDLKKKIDKHFRELVQDAQALR